MFICVVCYTVYYMKHDKCNKCGHKWLRRTIEQPVKCPKCHRRYYGVEKND